MLIRDPRRGTEVRSSKGEKYFIIVQSFANGEDKTANDRDNRIFHLPWRPLLEEENELRDVERVREESGEG